MSASSPAAAAAMATTYSSLRTLQVMRYAVGTTIAVGVALGFDWTLSFLTPVLTLGFLATAAPRPTLRGGIGFVAPIAVACVAGILLGQYLVPYPFVCLPFMGLVLFRIFYAKARGTSPALIAWLLIAVLAIPLVSIQSLALAQVVAVSIIFGALITILLVWLIYGIMPDPPDVYAAGIAGATASAAPKVSQEEGLRSAVKVTIVVFPMVVLFYSLEWVSSLLILIFIAMLSSQPGFAKSFKAGLALIIGNAVGGIAAVIIYELLVLMPEFGFLLVLMLLAGLVFGARVFSGKPTAPLYAMAFSTLVLVIVSTTSSSGDAGAKVYTRVIQIMIAVSYAVLALRAVERLSARRKVV